MESLQNKSEKHSLLDSPVQSRFWIQVYIIKYINVLIHNKEKKPQIHSFHSLLSKARWRSIPEDSLVSGYESSHSLGASTL